VILTETALLECGPASSDLHLVLAHGAGAPMTSAFMEQMAQTLAIGGVRTTRFEFAYMAERRTGAPVRPPPPLDQLVAEYLAVITRLPAVPGQRLFIGGKSMGGRVASMMADVLCAQRRIAGCVCLGYPFHPARKPEQLRTAHLADLACPTLIVQGTRDALGCESEVATYTLSPAIQIAWLADGNHDFVPRVRSGATADQHMATAAERVANFLAATEL
jgi:uncharacterized protein